MDWVWVLPVVSLIGCVASVVFAARRAGAVAAELVTQSHRVADVRQRIADVTLAAAEVARSAQSRHHQGER